MDFMLSFGRLLDADTIPVQRAAKVQPTEADGGKYIGMAILLVTLSADRGSGNSGSVEHLQLVEIFGSARQHCHRYRIR